MAKKKNKRRKQAQEAAGNANISDSAFAPPTNDASEQISVQDSVVAPHTKSSPQPTLFKISIALLIAWLLFLAYIAYLVIQG